MTKKLAALTAFLILGMVFYQNCARVNFDAASVSAAGVTSTSTFALAVTGGGNASPVTSFTAMIGQTYDFQITGSSDEVTAGLDNAQSFLKKISGQCSGNGVYQPFTLDLTQAGTQFQFGDNSWGYSQNLADSLSGCVWQICAQSALGSQACVMMTAQAAATTTTTTTPTTLVTPTTIVTTTTLSPTTTTMKATTTTSSTSTTVKMTTTTLPPTPTTMKAPPPTTTTMKPVATTSTTTTTTQPKACSFNGKTIASGQGVTAYQAATVGYGHACVSQTRTCSNGTLSGSYSYSSCTVNTQPDCPPSKVILSYSCVDNNGCGEWKTISERGSSSGDLSLKPQSAVYYRSANESQFLQKVMFFGGQCPGSVSGGATGDVTDVTLKPFQYGGGGEAELKCQNGAWVVISGDCDGNYGLCTYPKEGNVMVCNPSVTPNST
jgi:hypothetical protein